MKKNLSAIKNEGVEMEYAHEIATTIKSQIIAMIGQSAFNSWGVVKMGSTVINGKDGYDIPALALGVDARLFKGVVVIGLSGGDTYEVWLKPLDPTTLEAELAGDGIYCDQLGGFIDRIIEVGDDWEEYERFCEEERKKLIYILN